MSKIKKGGRYKFCVHKDKTNKGVGGEASEKRSKRERSDDGGEREM